MSSSFSVAAFNLHWGIGRHGPTHRRPYDALGAVRALDADVLVLPETWRPHGGADLVAPLADDGYHLEHLDFVTLGLRPRPRASEPGDGWWTLTVASRLPVTDRVELPMGRVFDDPAGPRAALGVTLDVGGTAVDLVGLHTSSKLWFGGPLVHLRGLRRRLPARDRPAVVAGDFNLWGPAVERLLPGWRRSVLGKTFPAPRPHHQIDHVLVNDRLRGRDGEVGPLTGSDHRSVRVELVLGP